MLVKPGLVLFLLSSGFWVQGVRAFRRQSRHHYGNFSRKTFTLADNMTDLLRNRGYPFLWFEQVSSTMDKARELIPQHDDGMFAIAAQAQSKGRGTRGRDWLSAQNNLLVTVVIKRQLLPVPITLLPLRVGTIIADSMARRVTATDSAVTLKWPNDVLINGRKACGVLIEMEGDYLLIGIGCNVLSAPEVNAATNNAAASKVIRPSTCLAEHNAQYAEFAAELRQSTAQLPHTAEAGAGVDGTATDATIASTEGVVPSLGIPIQEVDVRPSDVHIELGVEICDNLFDWLATGRDSAAQVVQDFERSMDYSAQRLRDEPDGEKGTVQPVGLNPDGTLKVRFKHSGEEGMLMAEYLW